MHKANYILVKGFGDMRMVIGRGREKMLRDLIKTFGDAEEVRLMDEAVMLMNILRNHEGGGLEKDWVRLYAILEQVVNNENFTNVSRLSAAKFILNHSIVNDDWLRQYLDGYKLS